MTRDNPGHWTRRDFLAATLAGAAVRGGAAELQATDEAFLDDLQHRSFLYFWEQADAKTGLVPDRSAVSGGPPVGPSIGIGSSAATGFGLTALCIGAERKWITPHEALERVRATFRFFAFHAFQQRGWFLHWMDQKTGDRRWNSEVSSIDTALLLGGILTAAQRFGDDPEIANLAAFIYDRIDFDWMLNGDPLFLSHGWTPEKGFIKFRWHEYAEMSMLYLLGIGSSTHPIPPKTWYGWGRPLYSYGPFQFISGGPLFTHQYSHAWVDFRNRRDRGFIEFFQNSVSATRSNRLFCMNVAKSFPLSFDDVVWGITASDSVKGYKIYSEIEHFAPVDGTVAPCAPGGSLMFAPDICIPALKTTLERFGDRVFGRYGFVDAFNPEARWFDTDVIGIDLGITLLSAENLRSGNVWRWFMRNKAVPRAMNLVGFEPKFALETAPAKAAPAGKKPVPPRRGKAKS